MAKRISPGGRLSSHRGFLYDFGWLATVAIATTSASTAEFASVLAKHSKSFSFVDAIAVGVARMQRNFEPMRK